MIFFSLNKQTAFKMLPHSINIILKNIYVDDKFLKIIDKFYCKSYNQNCLNVNYVCNLLVVLEAPDLPWDLVFHQILVVPSKNIIGENMIKKLLTAFTLFCFDYINLTLLSNILNF